MKSIANPLIGATVMGVAVYIATRFLVDVQLGSLIALICIGVLSYCLFLVGTERTFVRNVMSMFVRPQQVAG
jgi:hypothetical protein